MAITAQQIYDRMRWNIGGDVRWGRDTFVAGKPDTVVTGIVTSFAPNIEILRKGVAAGKNMFVCRESPYWWRTDRQGSAPPTQAELDASATYRLKRDFIAEHKVVCFRLRELWEQRVPDGQLVGLVNTLGWTKYYTPGVGKEPWATENGFFKIPPSTVRKVALEVKKQLGVDGLRIAGNPDQPVTKVAVYHGIGGIPEVRRLFAQPGVDLIVMGEPTWEFYPGSYALDAASLGIKRPIIFTGHQASEEPGSGEMAKWLKGFVPEVPVEWMPARCPTWALGRVV